VDILNFLIQFNTNSDKVTAQINKLDAATINVGRAAIKVDNAFVTTLNNIEKKLGTINIASKIQNITSSISGLGSVAQPGLDFSSSLTDLSVITGETGKGLQQIGVYARQNAKEFGGSAAQSVESFKLILSQLSPEIAKQPKALQEMGKNVSILSKQMGGDAVAATEVLTTAMNQYGVDMSNPIKASDTMREMMNVMAAAAQKGSAELPQIKGALEQVGGVAKAVGVSFSETNAAIQVLDKAGKKGSEGGIALRNVMTTLSEGRFLPPAVKEELQSAGIDINGLGDKTKSFSERLSLLKPVVNDTALLTKLFGKENLLAGQALVNGTTDLNNYNTAIQNTNTALEQAAIKMEEPAEKNKRLQAQVDNFKISLFNASGGVMGYVGALGNMAQDVGNLIPLFGGVTSVIKTLTNTEKMKSFWDGVVSISTTVWAGAQKVLNMAFWSNPITWVIAAIIALIAAITYVIIKTDGWGKAWKHVVQGAKYLWGSYIEFVKANFNLMIQSIMIGIGKIQLGWYKFKEAVGMGDSKANQVIIAKISEDIEQRKQSIKDGYQKMAATALKAKNEFEKAGGSLKWNNKSMGDVTGGLKEKLGITPPAVPGVDPNATNLGGDDKNKDKTQINEAIATGGTKHNYITITLGNMVETINVSGRDFKEGVNEMETQVQDAMMRILGMAVTVGN